jgi:PAS domain S-box-containing protein
MLSEGQRIAHLGSWEYAADTRTTMWSEEEFRIYGLTPAMQSPTYDELVTKYIHPDDVTLLRKTFGAALNSCSVFELEHRIIRPNGSVRFLYNRAEPQFDENGRLVKYAGATLDITERTQAEEALRKANTKKGSNLRLTVVEDFDIFSSCLGH